MPSPLYLAAVVAVAATITLALRAAPFAMTSTLRASPLVSYLGRHLPAGVMIILVVHLLRDLPVDRPLLSLRELVPVLVTVAVHLWRRDALLSMATGTAVYALALAVVPA
ncbi:branched-chain amino acid transporter permease [Actinomycetospora sp. CA-101289]|uniref:branched-chain amino acid transporter permease n=1 Tax=Actinomycetospora sp. CA-101289 TaxID=3239893 RepID=UPI003D98499C